MEPFRHPMDDPENLECETRQIINAFIRREYIALPKWCWLYLDWYAEQGHEIGPWLRQIDRDRGDYPLAEAIQYSIWYCDCYAYKDGGPRPDGLLPPQGWEFVEDEYSENSDDDDPGP